MPTVLAASQSRTDLISYVEGYPISSVFSTFSGVCVYSVSVFLAPFSPQQCRLLFPTLAVDNQPILVRLRISLGFLLVSGVIIPAKLVRILLVGPVPLLSCSAALVGMKATVCIIIGFGANLTFGRKSVSVGGAPMEELGGCRVFLPALAAYLRRRWLFAVCDPLFLVGKIPFARFGVSIFLVGLVESILVLSNTGLTLRGQSVLAMLVVSEKLRRRRILLTALATYLCFRSLSPHKLDSAVEQALRGKLGTNLVLTWY